MTKFEEIQEIIGKGLSLTQADVDDVRAKLVAMDADEAHKVEPFVWEALALILLDEQYRGDATLPAPA